jgi:hypothetical protein
MYGDLPFSTWEEVAAFIEEVEAYVTFPVEELYAKKFVWLRV